MVQQRSLLLKLITLLGGNVNFKKNFLRKIFNFIFLLKITINRNRANIIVGQSSKILQIVVYPQVNEQWAIG
jgi:hypothetical protein